MTYQRWNISPCVVSKDICLSDGRPLSWISAISMRKSMPQSAQWAEGDEKYVEQLDYLIEPKLDQLIFTNWRLQEQE